MYNYGARHDRCRAGQRPCIELLKELGSHDADCQHLMSHQDTLCARAPWP